MILIITISTFACIVLGVMALYWLMYRPPSAATERLQQLGHPNTTVVNSLAFESSPVVGFADRVAEPLGRLAPPSAAEAKKLQKQLMQAGYRSRNASAVYRSIQLVALFGFPSIAMLAATMLARPFTSMLMWMLGAFVVGFFLPRYMLKRITKKRELLIRWGLADALDLMVISIEAGLGLNAAMVRVSQELKEVHPEICEEFELTNLEIRVGREREEALRNLAERTGVDDLRSLVAMLIQADRFGTSITKAVRVYSDSMRTKRRQRAEQAAQKAAVKLLFPLACFLFPTLFIAILGPAFISLSDVFSQMAK